MRSSVRQRVIGCSQLIESSEKSGSMGPGPDAEVERIDRIGRRQQRKNGIQRV